jgi:molybdopterin-biosynthesis enzyme MoeA-like protein
LVVARTRNRLNLLFDTPEGAELIDNPVSVAPGFTIGNVHVLPGVPSILQAMFQGLKSKLQGGAVVRSRTITLVCPEGDIAQALGKIQQDWPVVEIGSYPFMRQGSFGTSLVLRSTDEDAIAQAADAILAEARKRNVEVLDLF